MIITSSINFRMLNWIHSSYQGQCIRSPEYFITQFCKPDYYAFKLLINYENMGYISDGQFIPKAKAKNSPSVDLTSYITEGEPFTLIMNDENSAFPSGNTVHWVIVNITTTSGLYNNNQPLPGITLQGKQLYGRVMLLLFPPEYGGNTIDYIGPAPPINTGFHKYVFSLYTQNTGEITYQIPIPIEESQQDLFSQLGILPTYLVTSLYFVSSYYPI